MEKKGATPPPSSPLERRFALLTRLLQGERVAAIASALGASVTTLHKDVSYLVEVGALRKTSQHHARLRFEPGERSGAWLKLAQEAVNTHRGERSATAGLAIRAHHWRWSRAFTSGPASEPPWTGGATASGVASRWLSVESGGDGFTVRAYVGKTARRLQIVAPPVVCENGPDVLAAEDRMGVRARAVGEGFARRYGVQLVGSWKQSHPTEYGGPRVPGLRPFGAPGVDAVWADESPGEGETEIETRAPSLAAAWSDLPAFERATEARLAAVESAVLRIAAREARALGVIERVAALVEGEGFESMTRNPKQDVES